LGFISLLLALQGCSVITIMNAPTAKYDRSLLGATGADSQTIIDNFGEPVEAVSYISPVIVRRDLHEYPVGVRHKVWYSLLSASAAVYTIGLSELLLLPSITQAVDATSSVRIYYGADQKVYGSASYNKATHMWLPNFSQHAESFKDGFPCYDFSAAFRKVLVSFLERKNRPDLVEKVTNCLSLERVQAAAL
jgi:hypothetical protein